MFVDDKKIQISQFLGLPRFLSAPPLLSPQLCRGGSGISYCTLVSLLPDVVVYASSYLEEAFP